MTIEKENKLVKRFDFYHTNEPLTESLMAFGFECGDGWFNILWDLSEKIEKILQECKDDYFKKYFKVIQVKEKYGVLNFYTSIINDEIFSEIENAEKKSKKTCEVCGKPGTVIGEFWLKTLCTTCANQLPFK